MKFQILVIIVVGALLACVVGGLLMVWPLESAQSRLNHKIDEKVAVAQRMLASYNPYTTRLSPLLGPTATQPSEVPDELWRDIVSKVEQEGVISGPLQAQRDQVARHDQVYAKLEGVAPRRAIVPAGEQALRELQGTISRNDKLISDALRIVQEARQLSDGEASGTNHFAVNRLEAILCYHQADMWRRQADLREIGIEQSYTEYTDYYKSWLNLELPIRTLAGDLGEQFATTMTGSSQPASSVAADHDAGEQVYSLDARIAELQKKKVELENEITSARNDSARLSGLIADLEKRIADVEKQAGDAERQMLVLEARGISPGQADSLDQFTQSYRAASDLNRKAFREWQTLAEGSLRDVHVESADDDRVNTSPLVGKKTTERGLKTLKDDLAIAELLARNMKSWLDDVTLQIEALSLKKKELARRAEILLTARAQDVEKAANVAKAIIAAAIEADQLRLQAIELLQNLGKQAAQRARQAADKRIREADELNSANNPESRNPRLSMISDTRFTTGHAITIIGDMAYMIAYVQTERIDALTWHQAFLDTLKSMGIKVDKGFLPAGVSSEKSPDWAIQVGAAQEAANQARKEVVDTAKEALEEYEKADQPLKQLWVLHANMAAVKYLLANLYTGEEAEQYRDQARQQYLRAIKDREDRPETPIYKEIVAAMSRPAE